VSWGFYELDESVHVVPEHERDAHQRTNACACSCGPKVERRGPTGQLWKRPLVIHRDQEQRRLEAS
jgi:hypothetical protein